MGYSRFCQVVNINHHLSEIAGCHQVFQGLPPCSVTLLSLNCDWELGVSSRQNWLWLLSSCPGTLEATCLDFPTMHRSPTSGNSTMAGLSRVRICQLPTLASHLNHSPLTILSTLSPTTASALVKGAHMSEGQEAV